MGGPAGIAWRYGRVGPRGLKPGQFVAPVSPYQSWSIRIASTGFRLEELVELAWHTLEFVRVSRSVLLAGQVGPLLGILPVYLKPLLGFRLGVGDDRLGRALRFADAAVDALVGLDHKHVIPLVEAVDGAHLDAVGIFALDAVFGDNVGHARFPFFLIQQARTVSAVPAYLALSSVCYPAGGEPAVKAPLWSGRRCPIGR